MTPLGPAEKQMISLDPLGLGALLFPTIQVPFHQKGGRNETGLYRTNDNRTFFMFLTPTEPPQNIAFSKKLMQEIQAVEKTGPGSGFKPFRFFGNSHPYSTHRRLSHCRQR